MSEISSGARTDAGAPLEEQGRAVVPAEARERASAPPAVRRAPWWVDVLLFVALFAAALPLRFAITRGDLWLDEADYAFAAARGFQANRWDISDYPKDPDKLIAQRHYHPPCIAYMVALALHFSPEDRALRVPAVLIGALTVPLVYLCGLALCGGRRSPAVAAAVLLLVAPAHLRASSHALPWSFLIFWLMLLVWTLLKYVETRREGWLVGGCAALGGMFVTSEVFFPTLLASAYVTPFLFWPAIQEADRRKRILIALGCGALVFLAIVWALWPAGLHGDAMKMLRHYMAMSHDPWPANVRGRLYLHAPKWAYLYWYEHDYRPFFVCYSLGVLAVLVLLARRQLTAGMAVLLVFTAIILLTAHAAHIIGPEYLVHALPLLSLVAGLFVLPVARWQPVYGAAVAAAVCLTVLLWHPAQSLSGMDPRSQRPRWPLAARFLATQWQPVDQMLAPAYGIPARWYLLHVARVPARPWQIEALPDSGARDPFLHDICSGAYRYVAVGNTFLDTPSIDPRIAKVIRTWPVLWQSNEHGTGPSRLTIYKLPHGVTSHHPLPMPKN
ncbi:MAG TPA: glycosyltransferase family 39 protein [Chthonomonadaceae bacterium]|nr:glycosyltransferase family 39 protein [Chthonomonadaceae bacterium]